jgi:hypothetical protein
MVMRWSLILLLSFGLERRSLSQPLLFLTTHAHSAKEEEHEALPKTLSLGEDKDYIVSAAITAYLFTTQIYNIYTRGCAH